MSKQRFEKEKKDKGSSARIGKINSISWTMAKKVTLCFMYHKEDLNFRINAIKSRHMNDSECHITNNRNY